jgi:bacterioferritin-associated ferredoxin
MKFAMITFAASVGSSAAAIQASLVACDTSSWTGVRTPGGVRQECGSCKVLANTGKVGGGKPFNCDSYCEEQGRSCVGAWEESSDTCNVKHDMTCDEVQFWKDPVTGQKSGTADTICECAESPQETAAAAAWCDTSDWTGIRNPRGVKQHCGSCKVLALPKNCASYCLEQGLTCEGAWEELSNSCEVNLTTRIQPPPRLRPHSLSFVSPTFLILGGTRDDV